jgi:ATP-dependent Clp protease adapter protein ClpS
MTTAYKNDTQINSVTKPASRFALILLDSMYVEGMCVVQTLKDALFIPDSHVSAILQSVQGSGSSTIGTYTQDIAETKAELAMDKLKEIHEQRGLDEPTPIFVVRELD